MVDCLWFIIGKYTIPMDAMGMVRDRYILPFIRGLIIPSRERSHIPPEEVRKNIDSKVPGICGPGFPGYVMVSSKVPFIRIPE